MKQEDQEAYEQIVTIVKDRKIRVEAANVGRLRPGVVVEKVKQALPGTAFSMYTHTCLYKLLKVRPPGGADDPFETNPDYCHYDEAHDDYLYLDIWPDFIIDLLQSGRASVQEIHKAYKNDEEWDINDYIV